MPGDDKKETEKLWKLQIVVLKIGQKEFTAQDFYRQRQVTDIFTIDETRWSFLIKSHAIIERTVVIL